MNDWAEVWRKLSNQSTVMATSGEPKCILCTVELSAQESYCQLKEKGANALNTKNIEMIPCSNGALS